jgi:hypothetical protein
MNAIVKPGKLPSSRYADEAVERYGTWGELDKIPGTDITNPYQSPASQEKRRNRCLQTIKDFDRLAVTAPEALVIAELMKLVRSKPGATLSDDFGEILIEDLFDATPEVSVMAVLRGFKKLRSTETDFMPSIGKIVSTIVAEEREFRGARSALIRSAKFYGYVGPERQIPPPEPKGAVAVWEDDIPCIPPPDRGRASLVAEGDTDGDTDGDEF